MVDLPEARLTLASRIEPRAAGVVVAAGGDTAVIDADRAAGGLFVRSRRPGDALRPLGLGGRKKLQDVLVDRKVPRVERDRVPLVVDERDRLLWIGGHVVAEDARVTDRTQTVVILKLSRLSRLGEGA